MDALEKKASITQRFLESMGYKFENQTLSEAQKWRAKIDTLQQQFGVSRTLIGIVGATGAGKSSLINALLDEERVVPTSGMRACTAVVTEISYNNGPLPYRAEIDFITREQWEEELRTLLGDLVDEYGNIARECYNSDSEAGLAYAKLKAVYPHLSKDQLVKTSIEELMSDRTVAYLSRTESFAEKDCKIFSEKILKYIDSKEKVDGRTKSAKPVTQAPEYWPLIRGVRLYTKSPTLATGAVLVDLPGVHDSNAARAAVAKNYMKQCSAFFIVAAISRAVDDKSAKNLLGHAFKQQIKLDGEFGNITFICSKTDQISIEETLHSLDLDDQAIPLQREIEEQKQSRDELEEELVSIEDAERDMLAHSADATRTLSSYRALLPRAQRGERVFEPIDHAGSNKRKSTRSHKRSVKRTKQLSDEESASDTDHICDVVSDSDESVQDCNAANKELSINEIENKIAEASDATILATEELRKLRRKCKDLKAQKKEQDTGYKRSQARLELMCITARNEYSREAIKQDFAAGVQEIDQELAQEEDPENFDPSQVARDYNAVAEELSVFCVSASGYQKLNGRRKKDRRNADFGKSDDTEIPQLQAHCRHIAEDIKLEQLKAFLNKTEILMNSLRLWCFGDSRTSSLTETELADMDRLLRADLDAFSDTLLATSTSVATELKTAMQNFLYASFPRAVVKAQSEAANTVQHWGDPIDRDNQANSGLRYQTYRATLRRYGFFAKKEIVHDFNRDLADPLVRRILPGWEKVFGQDVPKIFEKAASEYQENIKAFQEKVAIIMAQHNVDNNKSQLLDQQLRNHIKGLKVALENMKKDIRKGQKEINRNFIPTISQEMFTIYDECNNEIGGNGVYLRLKALMQKGVSDLGQSMFRSCTDTIRTQLDNMIETQALALEAEVTNIARWIAQDYMQLSVDQTRQVLGEEKSLKDSILSSLEAYESELAAQDIGAAHQTQEIFPADIDQYTLVANLVKQEHHV